jgi:hypothetical protein
VTAGDPVAEMFAELELRDASLGEAAAVAGQGGSTRVARS